MSFLELVYGECGIDVDGADEIDAKKVSINGDFFDELIEKVQEEFDLTPMEANLIFLNYGPSVKENQNEPVKVHKGAIQ